jgi:hypothetical protein
MRGEAGEERASALRRECAPGEQTRRQEARKAQPREHQRMTRDLDERRERVRGQLGPASHERRNQAAPGAAIRAEPQSCLVQRAAEHDRGAVLERMGERKRWLDPLESERSEVERAEERRRRAHRVEGRADVMKEAGKGQLRGAAAAANRVIGFHHRDGASVPRQLDRG